MKEVCNKLLSCAFDRLPKSVQDVYLSRPVLIAPVEPAGNGFRLSRPDEFVRPAPVALTPKLGIKSWREAGGLGVIYEGVAIIAVLNVLLQNPTEAQTLMARAWTRTGTQLNVYLSPYVDFSDISEVRYLAQGGICRRISACLRDCSTERFDAQALRLARAAEIVAERMGDGVWIIDLALQPNDVIRFVEVNPGLTPRKLRHLRCNQPTAA